MKISVIGTVGLPANYGGFETLTENLVKYLGDQFRFTVYCSSSQYAIQPRAYKNADLVYLPLKANGVQSTPYDILSVFKASFSTDILLILGVSGCICLPFIKMISNKKIIVHIDGLEWRREKWGRLAKMFLKYSERCGVKYSDIVIADNVAIKNYISAEYQKESVLIEYGGDHVIPDNYESNASWPLVYPQKTYAVKVCRIEPENNVHVVLNAFSRVKNMPLVIIGNWSNSKYGQNLKKMFHGYKNLTLLDPIYDQKQLYTIRSSAALYIHGHSAGGTNPSLVEAMYLGLPVIAYDIEYNRETTKNKAVYFKSEKELESIVKGFEEQDMSTLADQMKILALKYYNWRIIADKYAKLF